MLAITTAVIGSQSHNVTAPSGMLSAYKPALVVITGITVLGLLIGLAGLGTRPAAEAAELEAVQKELADEEMIHSRLNHM